MNKDEKVSHLGELYARVIQTANQFLYNAKTFQIEVLQEHDPSYEELAEIIDDVCKVITILCEDVDDPLTGQKAYEYCAYMKGMAAAIKDADEPGLAIIVEELDRRSFL